MIMFLYLKSMAGASTDLSCLCTWSLYEETRWRKVGTLSNDDRMSICDQLRKITTSIRGLEQRPRRHIYQYGAIIVLLPSRPTDFLQVLSIVARCKTTCLRISHEEVLLSESATSTIGFPSYRNSDCLSQNENRIPIVPICRKMQLLRSLTVISIEATSRLLRPAQLAFLRLSIGPMEVGTPTIGNIARRLILHRLKASG